MARLDNYEKRPSGMDEYLSTYGWHFSKAMAKFAISQFYPDQELPTIETMNKYASRCVAIKTAKGYDAYFLFVKFRMLIPEMQLGQIALIVDSYLSKNYDTMAFTNFYSDCIANGIPIIWEDNL